MGFSSRGRQCLHPEEALYLMECGNVQVFYQDLPLSIQDGYERFLSGGSASSVSLQQYQVFGHLRRLGYVVHRFDPSSELSSYERQLNLHRSRDKAGVKRKRSTSPSPTPTSTSTPTSSSSSSTAPSCSQAEADGAASTCQQMEAACVPGAGEGGQSPAEGAGVRHPPAAAPRWDFSSIHFPDLGYIGSPASPGSPAPHGCLAPPDPALLPDCLAVPPCDVAPWRHRVNLRQVKMSSGEQRQRDDERRRRPDVSTDPEVQQCRNWAEYHELLARRRAERAARPPSPTRPAHLWNREVTPLVDPDEDVSTAELLEKLRQVQTSHLLDGASRLKASDEWRISFNVYQPDTVADFKKSRPGKPHCRVCVCSFSDPVPDLRALKLLALQSGDVQVVVAVVDHGDMSFYTFKDFQLPTDVFG
ncbi:tRNA-splicing endonuclease subunit Sen54 isoform X2 [Salarias fasciatus]|nr:tRNA-splicing endonuclease subunit Sen54 isoform X2 [Salarias fasciatus]